MIRLMRLPDGLYVVTAPIPRLHLPSSKHEGMQCMCCGIVRRATPEDINQWRQQ